MLAVDTEDTGLDFWHGARPFFVTCCNEQGYLTYWEWDVDPLTRKVAVPEEDARTIRQLLAKQHDGLVLHNAKFDAHALRIAGITDWTPLWPLTEDTLVASHILASNQWHDLTSLTMHNLGIDIEPFEKKLEEAVKECRSLVQKAKLKVKKGKGGSLFDDGGDPLASWAIAEKDATDMPSVKEKTWKVDSWLPRAMARYLKLKSEHPWWSVLRDYSNADSAATARLWPVLKADLEERGKWELYRRKMLMSPILWGMEDRGVTLSIRRLAEVTNDCKQAFEEAGHQMISTAEVLGEGFKLDIPDGSRNASLEKCCFEILDMPVYKTGKTGPSIDKEVVDRWTKELDGERQRFAENLMLRRQRGMSLQYLQSYSRFAIPIKGSRLWATIHPSINQTGTDTTRFSSQKPNSQNVSTKEDSEGAGPRTAFGPLPGRVWYSFDATNIELRIPAYRFKVKAMMKVFDREDEPPFYGKMHLLNFSIIYPEVWAEGLKLVGPEKVGEWVQHDKKQLYKRCKNTGFSLQYGAGKAKVDATAGRPGAYELIRGSLAELHGPGGGNDQLMKQAEKTGCVETAMGYPLMVARTEWGKVLSTTPLSYYVQGTAGEWMHEAMIRTDELIRSVKQPDIWMVLTVHDQLVFDFPKVAPRLWIENWVTAIRKTMESCGDLIGVKTPVSVELHERDWGKGVAI